MGQTDSTGTLSQIAQELRALAVDSGWPDTLASNAPRLLAVDLADHVAVLASAVAAEAWSAVLSMQRPLLERSEYLLASLLDVNFARKYLSLTQSEIGAKGARIRSGDARDVIRKHGMRREFPEVEAYLTAATELNRMASAFQHPSPHAPLLRLRATGSDTSTEIEQTLVEVRKVVVFALLVAAAGAFKFGIVGAREVLDRADRWLG